MHKKSTIIAFTLLVLLFASNLAVANNISGNKITDITVEGNDNVSDMEILNKVSTQVGDKIVNEDLKKDLQSIYELGYFLNVKINFRNYKNGVRLIFKVVENPIISKIKLDGNKVVSDSKIKDLLKVKTGKILDVNQLKKDIETINKYYQKEGYVLARVVNREIRDNDKLYLKINEGQLNKIMIKGNTKTKDFVIRREFDIKEGDVFDMKQIKTDLRDIHQLKLFKQVQPKFQRLKDKPQAVNLTVNVTEKRTNSFQAGLTHNPETGLAGLLDLTLKNYFGRAKTIKTKWEYGANKNHYEIGYSDPWASWLFDRKTSIDFSLYNKKETIAGDNKVRKYGGNFSIGRQLTDNTKGYLGVDASQIKEDDGWQDDRTLSLRTIRNTTINPFNPRTGSKQTISLEKAGLIGGDNNYAKYEFDYRKYFPSFTENSWAVRLKVGGSQGNIPDSKRYYLAGRNGVRGYGDEYYDEPNEDDSPKAYDATKEGFIGNSVLLGSIEYRYPIIDKLRGVVFVDAGKAFSGDNINLSEGHFKYSYGLGARVRTPIGELGLDYGYAPEASRGSKTDLSFTIGNKF